MVVEVQGLDAVVRADAVARGVFGHARGGGGFGRGVAAFLVGCGQGGIVARRRDDVEGLGHGKIENG